MIFRVPEKGTQKVKLSFTTSTLGVRFRNTIEEFFVGKMFFYVVCIRPKHEHQIVCSELTCESDVRNESGIAVYQQISFKRLRASLLCRVWSSNNLHNYDGLPPTI